ncbi:universal stress protein [Algibacter sp. 2305UL17-15]|uniref:universal stress protein n=1 Tax=Algibacter sp. 2305UL17-15 TaxID=3231268 RepID=UPI00345AD48C
MKTILYATDCSSNAASTLRYAYRFSSIMKADLHVLHVYDVPPINHSTILPLESLKKRIHQEQIELVEKYCKKHLKNEFSLKAINIHVVENDSISKSILRFSKISNPDVIIIGKKDHRSARGYFSGSITDALLDKIKVPLLMVPNDMPYNVLSNIVYASDFEEEDILSIQKLIEIASPFGALIEIVHVYEMDKDIAQENMGKFKKTLLKQVSYPEITFRSIVSSEIKSGLLSVLNNEKASMLAMLERKHNWGLHNLFHKDLIKDMEAAIEIPILAFNKRSIKIELQNAKTYNTKNLLVF